MFNEAPVAFGQRLPSEVRTQSTNLKQQKLNMGPPSEVRTQSTNLKQQKLNMGATKAPKAQVNPDLILTQTAICGGHPFDIWEQEEMVNFFNALSSDWEPPSEKKIVKRLLRECFENVEAQVLERIKHTEHLNFVLEDTFDLSRVINMSLITEGGALLLCTLSVPTYGQVTAGSIKEWACLQWEKLLGDDFQRINSITTDTDTTMTSLWALLNKDPRTAHIFTVPCDSHALKHFVNGILSSEPFNSIFLEAKTIVKRFAEFPKQYSLLVCKMDVRRPLTASLMAGWGTKLRMLDSFLANEDALIEYASDPQADLSVELKESLQSGTLFEGLKQLRALLQPVHMVIRQPEGERASLSDIPGRWQKLWTSLNSMGHKWPEVSRLTTEVDWSFSPQVKPIHLAAWALDSDKTRDNPQPLHPAQEDLVIEFLRAVVRPQSAQNRVVSQFLHYRSRKGFFRTSSLGWEMPGNREFWLYYSTRAPELSAIALRLLNSVANSVPSERDFSIQNIRYRPDDSPIRAYWQTYIYINCHTLKRIEGKGEGPVRILDLTEEDAMDLEDLAWAMQSEPYYLW